ncbi:hypothetical protein ABIE13_003230 [Ottowia thiooxydans]|uniref:Uncharacterized protein n=1 Tax=Ottowia thiooxydans TaxID=219182 RepID=A0ABV2QAQ9_9BURK
MTPIKVFIFIKASKKALLFAFRFNVNDEHSLAKRGITLGMVEVHIARRRLEMGRRFDHILQLSPVVGPSGSSALSRLPS